LTLRRALYSGFADRLARRRAGDPGRVTLASGHGASLSRESGVREGEFLVALEVQSADRRGVAEARVQLASRVEPEWVIPTSEVVEHAIDPASGQVRARRVTRVDALVIGEIPVAVDAGAAAAVLATAWQGRGPGEGDAELLRRLRFAQLEVDVPAVIRDAARRARTLDEVRLEAGLPAATGQALARLAPTTLAVPSGRQAPLSYGDDGSVTASVKLQELFGLAETPVLGAARVAVTFSLLAPNGRPVQTTRDLKSFWQRGYPEVRKELRGRYPKHPWPEDPWTAIPTHRTTRNARK
jgi:ATP-dependent helicase HrpB